MQQCKKKLKENKKAMRGTGFGEKILKISFSDRHKALRQQNSDKLADMSAE
jgi:hypothetical protein